MPLCARKTKQTFGVSGKWKAIERAPEKNCTDFFPLLIVGTNGENQQWREGALAKWHEEKRNTAEKTKKKKQESHEAKKTDRRVAMKGTRREKKFKQKKHILVLPTTFYREAKKKKTENISTDLRDPPKRYSGIGPLCERAERTQELLLMACGCNMNTETNCYQLHNVTILWRSMHTIKNNFQKCARNKINCK